MGSGGGQRRGNRHHQHSQRFHHRHAESCAQTEHKTGIPADRRQQIQTVRRLQIPVHSQGSRKVRFYRGSLRPCQDIQGRAHEETCAAIPSVWLGKEYGISYKGARGGHHRTRLHSPPQEKLPPQTARADTFLTDNDKKQKIT